MKPAPNRTPRPLSLSDTELKRVLAAARSLSPDKRNTLLERVAAELQFRAYSDGDLDRIVERALRGLLHGPV